MKTTVKIVDIKPDKQIFSFQKMRKTPGIYVDYSGSGFELGNDYRYWSTGSEVFHVDKWGQIALEDKNEDWYHYQFIRLVGEKLVIEIEDDGN